MKTNKLIKAVFLDRDGVINEDKGYIKKIKDFKILPGVIKAISLLNKHDFLVICITNQSGIGRGYFNFKELNKLHKYLNEKLKKKNCKIKSYYICPHHPKYAIGKYKVKCKCRKPRPGLINNAIEFYKIDKKKSFMVGNSQTDKIAAKSAGIRFFFKRKESFDIQIGRIIKKMF